MEPKYRFPNLGVPKSACLGIIEEKEYWVYISDGKTKLGYMDKESEWYSTVRFEQGMRNGIDPNTPLHRMLLAQKDKFFPEE